VDTQGGRLDSAASYFRSLVMLSTCVHELKLRLGMKEEMEHFVSGGLFFYRFFRVLVKNENGNRTASRKFPMILLYSFFSSNSR